MTSSVNHSDIVHHNIRGMGHLARPMLKGSHQEADLVTLWGGDTSKSPAREVGHIGTSAQAKRQGLTDGPAYSW